MNGIPGEFPLPRTAFEQQRALLAAHVEAERAGSSGGRRLALAVAVAAFAVVFAAAALAVRVFVLDKGFVGLPPNGATPSTPESGRLVASLAGRNTTDETLAIVYLYADGRLIWARHTSLREGANPFVTGMLEQRLTSQGVERMRSRFVSTGMFDHDAALVSDRFIWGRAGVRVGHRFVSVDWSRPGNNDPSDPDTPARVTATTDQERGLERLDALLAHPTRGLPASAWDDRRIRAFVPSMFAVCWDSSPAKVSDPQSDPSRVLSQLPSAARDLLVGKQSTRRRGKRGWAGGPYFQSATDCANVTTAEAQFLSRILDAAGIDRTDAPAGLQYSFVLRGGIRETAAVTFEPLLPNRESTSFRTG